MKDKKAAYFRHSIFIKELSFKTSMLEKKECEK